MPGPCLYGLVPISAYGSSVVFIIITTKGGSMMAPWTYLTPYSDDTSSTPDPQTTTTSGANVSDVARIPLQQDEEKVECRTYKNIKKRKWWDK